MKFPRLSVANKSFNSLIVTGLLLVSPALSATPVCAQSLAVLVEKPSEKILTKEELYFGLSKPAGGTVTEAEWQLFLNLVITPRFPTGLTVVAAEGQYLNSSQRRPQVTSIFVDCEPFEKASHRLHIFSIFSSSFETTLLSSKERESEGGKKERWQTKHKQS